MTTLTLMVGPAGSGKSSWLASEEAKAMGIHPSHVISSDQLRQDLCGDFRDQSRNQYVFNALHDLVVTRLSHGLDTVVDSTNLTFKARKPLLKAAGDYNAKIRYLIAYRTPEQRKETGGWRNELPIDLYSKHEAQWNSEKGHILDGDFVAEVIDLGLYRE